MPIDLVMLSAAFITGLIGSVHCLVMCGGVATGLAAASRGRDEAFGTGTAALQSAIALNIGRVLGYTVAGALVGGFGTAILSVLDADRSIMAMRLAVGIVLVLVGLRLIDGRDRLGRVGRIGQAVWPALRRLGRGLLPADRSWKQVALGSLWGWLPCGLSWSMLLAALFTVDLLHGALTMAAFGSGTLLAMIPLTWGSARLARRLAQPATRRTLGALVIAAGIITVAAPWLAQVPALHGLLSALGCRTVG